MATNGGVIIYGIGEDEHGQPTILNPIPIANQRERITSIVHSSVAETPSFSVSVTATSRDPSMGYIVVVVPPSERAPHMVQIKGEYRYYGRSDTGNIILPEGEVSRLYERRQQWQVNREELLDGEIKRAPLSANEDFAYLHIIAQPVFERTSLLEEAVRHGETIQRMLNNLVEEVSSVEVFPRSYTPDFKPPLRWLHTTEGFLGYLSWSEDRTGDELVLHVDSNGSAHLFCGRAGENHSRTNLEVFDSVVVGNTVRFFSLIGKLYERSKYLGTVDIGLAITGLNGSVIHTSNSIERAKRVPYREDDYRRTARVSALTLQDNSRDVAKQLMKPLFTTLSQGFIDPFKNLK